MKKGLVLILAAAIFCAAASPALAAAGPADGLSPEVAQAYLDIVDGLAAEHGRPYKNIEYYQGVQQTAGWDGHPSYTGMGGGFVTDLGGDSTPELIVSIGSKTHADYGAYYSCRVWVYFWNGSEAVQAGEYTIRASANGRSWQTVNLRKSGDSACIECSWEYLPDMFDPDSTGGIENYYEKFDGSGMVEFSSGADFDEVTPIAAYDYNFLCNYEELSTLLRQASGGISVAWYQSIEGVTPPVFELSYIAWTDAHPFINADNRTMVPLRAVAEALNLNVSWDAAAQTAVFEGYAAGYNPAYRSVRFPVGSDTVTVVDYESAMNKGTPIATGTVKMDTAAVNVDGRVYAPVRYLAEAFGHQVSWDGATKTAVIELWVGRPT